MKDSTTRSARTSALFVVGSLALVAGVMLIDVTVLRFGILVEDTRPYTTPAFLARGAVLALAAALFFVAIVRLRRPDDCPLPPVPREWYDPLLQWTALAATVAAAEVFWVDSRLFYELAREDHLVENASAVFLFGTAACFLWLVGQLCRGRPRRRLALLTGVIGLAAAFFFLGMEEVSWLQRVFAYHTPRFVRVVSTRNEFNLHNVDTPLFEMLYYFGSFVFLVVVPFVRERTTLFDRVEGLDRWLPTCTTALVVAPAYAFNYVFWNLTFTQFAFWFTLLFVLWRLDVVRRDAAARPDEKLFALYLAAGFLLAQGVFMALGHRFVRLWDATEYKEMFIALGYLSWGLIAARRIRAATREENELTVSRSRLILIGGLFVLVVLNYGFRRVMTWAETDVMLLAKRFADPNYLPGDFALSQTMTPRTAFLVLMYPLLKILPLVKAAIVGRILAYLFMSTAVGLLAWRMGLGAGITWAAMGIYLWLGQGYLPVGDDLFKLLEALVPCYILLIFGLNAVVSKRLRLAALLAGAAFSFHVLVGLWGSLALVLTAATLRVGTWRKWLASLGLWCLTGSLGLYHGLSFMLEPTPDTPFDLTYVYVYFRNPMHFFPRYWGHAPGQYEVGLFLLVCVAIAALRRPTPENLAVTAVARFTLFTLLPFAAGLIALHFPWAPKFMEMTYPFRVGSTFLLPFGLLIALPPLLRFCCPSAKARHVLIDAAVIAVFWHAGHGFARGLRELHAFPEGGFQGGYHITKARYQVCHWMRDNLEPDALVLTPPDLQMIEHLSHHPIVLRWKSIPYTKAKMAEWYQRMTDLNGGHEPRHISYAGKAEVRWNFNHLTAEQYRALGRKYGAKYLLLRSRDVPGLKKLFDNRRYAVFSLTAPPPPPLPAPDSQLQPEGKQGPRSTPRRYPERSRANTSTTARQTRSTRASPMSGNRGKVTSRDATSSVTGSRPRPAPNRRR